MTRADLKVGATNPEPRATRQAAPAATRQVAPGFSPAIALLLALIGTTVQVQSPAGRPFWRTVVMGTKAMISAEHPLEALAAQKVLQSGGNAIDAAVAAFYMINPALALKDGKPFLAFNTPGGDNQPQAMLQAFLNVVEFGMNVQQAVEAPTVTTASFYASNYPQRPGNRLAIPKVLADQIGARLTARGHALQVGAMQQPYGQTPSGAGAVKMVMIDAARGVLFGGVSPAKDNYVIGW